MHLLKSIPCAQIVLEWDRPVDGPPWKRARHLRGALARAFSGDSLFHQRDAQGRLLYRYPRIQYRWVGGCGVVFAWAEAAERLLNLTWLDLALRLGREHVLVTDAHLQPELGEFGIGDRLLRYRWESPGILLNQTNYRRCQRLDYAERRAEVDRLLVAQILMGLRGLGVDFDGRLFAALSEAEPVDCPLKGQQLVGFQGGFVTNAVLPPGMGLGHAVSHGYGWIQPERIPPRAGAEAGSHERPRAEPSPAWTSS